MCKQLAVLLRSNTLSQILSIALNAMATYEYLQQDTTDVKSFDFGSKFFGIHVFEVLEV